MSNLVLLKKHAYIGHQLTGALEYPATPIETMRVNRLRASEWCAWASLAFDIVPSAAWIILSSVWPETPENRKRGLEIDCAAISRCDELWLCGPKVSGGMAIEAAAARELGIPIRDLTVFGWRYPPDMLVPGVAEQVQRVLLEAA